LCVRSACSSAISHTMYMYHTSFLTMLLCLCFVAGGVVASILVVICLFWIGAVDHVGFENKGSTLNLPGIPIAIGLYGYCYSGAWGVPKHLFFSEESQPVSFHSFHLVISYFGSTYMLSIHILHIIFFWSFNTQFWSVLL
jgi:hypothetical protein